jgi:hypothetical protein
LKDADDLIAAVGTLASRKKDWIDTVKDHATLKKHHEKTEAALKAEEKKSLGQSGELVSLLIEAKSYIEATSPLENCPVCEQDVKREKLSLSITNRIGAMQKVADLTTAAKASKKKLHENVSAMTSAMRKYAAQITITAACLKMSQLTAR